jgi:hypothetical protein
MSATRICPGCGDRRILLTLAAGQRMCIDCRDQAQGRLFGLEATLEDLDLTRDDHVEAPARAGPGASEALAPAHAGVRALGCRCDRPLTDDDGGCVRCGRWAVA